MCLFVLGHSSDPVQDTSQCRTFVVAERDVGVHVLFVDVLGSERCAEEVLDDGETREIEKGSGEPAARWEVGRAEYERAGGRRGNER